MTPRLVISRITPLADLPELLTVPEAAAWLGISKGLVYEMAEKRELPSVRLGRLLRIRRDGLQLFLEKAGAA